MSKITDLKMEYNRKLDSMPLNLEEEKLQKIYKLIADTPDLEHHIKRLNYMYVMQGMNITCDLLFNESINQL